jgi:diguanylate cyclase (GGDEF) domain
MTTQRPFDLAALLLGIASALVGGAALMGHALSIPALLRPSPEAPVLVFSAALAFAIGGAAVALAAWPSTPVSRRATTLGGALVALLGIIGLLERASGSNLGIDLPALHRSIDAENPAPGQMVPAAGLCFAVLGACLIALNWRRGRRAAIAMVVAVTLCGALGATSLVAYALDIEFLSSWPTNMPRSQNGALGMVLLAAGLYRVVADRAKRRPGVDQLGDSIHLTSVWMLSVIAIVAGVSTFTLAQYEYQNVVRSDLSRTLRERRTVLDYAISDHVQQVALGADAVFAASIGKGRRPLDDASTRARLQGAADLLTKTAFSGWRFDADGRSVASGRFVEEPEMTIRLAGRHATDLLLKSGQYYLRTRFPIRDGDREIGFAVAEDAFAELTRLKFQSDSWGKTGSMVICGAHERDADCLPSRNNPAGSRVPRTLNGRPLPVSLALDRQVGIYETVDYRGHRVLAAYGPIGFTGLGMVVKVDAAELNAPLGRRFGVAMLVLAALVAAGVWLLRRRLRPLTRALVEAREEAASVAAQFKAAAESSMNAYFLMDAVRGRAGKIDDFRIRYVNASGEVLAARPSEEMIGRTLRETLPQAQAEFFIDRYRRIVSTGESLAEEFRTSPSDVSSPWISHQAVKLGDGVSVTAHDITELKNTERQLRSQAEKDVLTGLPNRALFFDRLRHAMTGAAQSSSGVAVLFLDIDRFKQVNDTHGHAAGDAVLVEFAHRVRGLVRATDTMARLGGDEFAIILPKLAAIADAERVATDILNAIRAPFQVDGMRLQVGTSIGVGFSRGDPDTPEALVGRADRKLYQAKTAGRGRYSSAREKHAA